MGIAGKLGYTGIGLVALGALIFIFKDKLIAGSKSVGSAVGETIGGGIGSIGPSLVESFSRAASDIFSGGRAVGDNQTSLFGGGITGTQGVADPRIISNFGQNGIADYDYVSQDANGNIKYYKQGKLVGTVDSETVNQANREYSDMPNLLPSAAGMVSFGASKNIPFFAKPRPGTTPISVTTKGGSITSVTRSVSTKAAVAASSPSRQASFAKTQARAQATAKARAKARGKKCYNGEIQFGGAGHIEYREEGIFSGI